MQDLRLTTELSDLNVIRRLNGNHLNLLDEERKREANMDQFFTGKFLDRFQSFLI